MDRALLSLLDWYDHVGVETPPRPAARRARRIRPQNMGAKSASPSPKAAARPAQKQAAPARAQTPPHADAAPIAAACKTLSELKTAIEAFDAGALSDGATQAVISRGNPEADLMIIGEAPTRDEDKGGTPFTGPSGQLLDRMLAAISLTEADFYVGNVCFWHLPNNRKPDAAELDLCRPFVLRHIELAQPKVILLTGGTPMQALLGLSSIMKERGQWQSVSVGGRDIPALPVYHPEFLLKQPALKADAWQDLLSLRERLLAAD